MPRERYVIEEAGLALFSVPSETEALIHRDRLRSGRNGTAAVIAIDSAFGLEVEWPQTTEERRARPRRLPTGARRANSGVL